LAESLIEEATTRARLLDPEAVVFQVSGVNGDSLDGLESETLLYTFLALNPAERTVTHQLTYDGAEWATDTHPLPAIGVGVYDLREVDMTEANARALLLAAGHADDFFGWVLYRPLHPSTSNALYAFNYGDRTVTIDTRTEEVTLQTPAVDGPPAGGGAPTDDSVSLQVIEEANARIKEQARSAMIVWAWGRSGDGGQLDTPEDTAVWDFVAVDLDGTAWQLGYDGSWNVAELAFPPFEIEYLDLNAVLTMDVVEAWNLAVDAGYGPPYEHWEVFKPLHPDAENPVYIFEGPDGFVIVDTVTGEVAVETNCCIVDGCYGHCNP